MAAEGLWMSFVERERSHLVRQTQEKQLSQREACERLGSGSDSSSVWSGHGGSQGQHGLVLAACPVSGGHLTLHRRLANPRQS